MSGRVTTTKKANEASTDGDDQRLRAGDERAPTMLTATIATHEGGGEDVVPPARGVVADEERGRVAAERDGDHRADDHHRGDVAEPRGDADEAPRPEPLAQVGDQAARGRVADAELDADVGEQRGHDEAEEERDPDSRAGDRARLAEQREDAGADHGADPEHRRARDRDRLLRWRRLRPRLRGGAGGRVAHDTRSIRASWSSAPAPRCVAAEEEPDDDEPGEGRHDPADLQRHLEAVVDDALAEVGRPRRVGLGRRDLRAVRGQEEHADDRGPHRDHVAGPDAEREAERNHRARRGRLARREPRDEEDGHRDHERPLVREASRAPGRSRPRCWR